MCNNFNADAYPNVVSQVQRIKQLYDAFQGLEAYGWWWQLHWFSMHSELLDIGYVF